MSSDNIEQSIAAAEQALEHFVASLERAGFAEGATAYRRMADVMLGQCAWVDQMGRRDLDAGFHRVAVLAAKVAEQLRPYVTAMDKLRCLDGMLESWRDGQLDSLADNIVIALREGKRGLSAHELKRVTGASASDLKRELGTLLDAGHIAPARGRRGRFVLAGLG